MGGKGIAQSMRRSLFSDACPLRCTFNHVLQRFLVYMMASSHAGSRIDRQAARWKHILPTPFFRRIGIFFLQRVRQINRTIALRHVLIMQRPHPNQMRLQDAIELSGSIVTRSLKPLPSVHRQHHRQALWCLCLRHIFQPRQLQRQTPSGKKNNNTLFA